MAQQTVQLPSQLNVEAGNRNGNGQQHETIPLVSLINLYSYAF